MFPSLDPAYVKLSFVSLLEEQELTNGAPLWNLINVMRRKEKPVLLGVPGNKMRRLILRRGIIVVVYLERSKPTI